MTHGHRYCNWLQRTAFGDMGLGMTQAVTVLFKRPWTVRAIYPRAMLFTTLWSDKVTTYYDLCFNATLYHCPKRKQDFK